MLTSKIYVKVHGHFFRMNLFVMYVCTQIG